jgi:hypothetical protein
VKNICNGGALAFQFCPRVLEFDPPDYNQRAYITRHEGAGGINLIFILYIFGIYEIVVW